ncbi:bifunctional tryptophan synthase trp1 [Nowakowskiella sp. JEL0407]|nr:bifunctional tryptophan synthase trp1 [Nowakowskiella sp. JEL0407]
MTATFKPSIEELRAIVKSDLGNVIPVYHEISADLLTPVSAYLKIAHGSSYSFLFESVAGGEKLGRYSFLGARPEKVVKCGDNEQAKGDPLITLENELKHVKYVPISGIPKFTGGGVGYIAYDCVRYFEPRTARPLKDPLGLPDAIFMFYDTIIIFDHLHRKVQVVSHFKAAGVSMTDSDISYEYTRVLAEINTVVEKLNSETTPLPVQKPIELDHSPESNIGKLGYESFVNKLKHHIVEGNIIQAVPSQRLVKRTTLHPFNAYRHLRGVNPSPYMFFVDLKEFQIVGASPEMLVKVEDGIVYTHPIAGTRKRGKNLAEDEALALNLLGDIKERAEHVMLVDLGRNDVNRICKPQTVKVDSLMHIERYSHVMHIVSNVSGELRDDKTPFDAFRSIFPAGTVSGAPKVRAMELIYDLEQEKRGIYAGAVGYFAYSKTIDTAIAIRTMFFRDEKVYLQAGGGIVYDSVPEDEYEETINKLRSNVTALERAEKFYYDVQQKVNAPTQLLKLRIDIPHYINENQTTMTTLLIDNYDSFTWNLYQFLSELGANVIVHRNDKITIEECIALKPRNLVISPGPGHPREAGISIAAIQAFAGKIPIFGVCLGEQSIYEAFGGTVTYAGEIVHGKTSPISHDGKGIYESLPQNFEVTRYHSLSGDEKTLPDCLEVTSRTLSGVVMGVRHKEYVIDSVQYHPESIASEYGKRMIANFLKWEGGTWKDLVVNKEHVNWDVVELQEEQQRTGIVKKQSVFDGVPLSQISKLNSTGLNNGATSSTKRSNEGEALPAEPAKKKTILETIHEQRIKDVEDIRSKPGFSEFDLSRSIALGAAPKLINFKERLLSSMTESSPVAVCAEIKRASPSKGDIDLFAHAPSQAIDYAEGGAAVISVLTEPKWFKGSVDDMRQVRLTLDNIPNRPAVLRKDFIISKYQVLEARLNGADTLLLILAMLDDSKAGELLEYSRQIGMEPLVEVANEAEMDRAVKLGAQVIGVNNRDLHTFTVDMNKTSRLVDKVPKGTILIALSGIFARADVEKFYKDGVRAVLVGESLMRSEDKVKFLGDLRLCKTVEKKEGEVKFPIVKVCGVTNLADALTVGKSGADVMGLIFAEKSPRKVTIDTAKEIVLGMENEFGALAGSVNFVSKGISDGVEWFSKNFEHLVKISKKNKGLGRPLIVGVFQNQTVDFILRAVNECKLDLVQFHGDESVDLALLIPVPVIKVVHVEIKGGNTTVDNVITEIEKGVGKVGFVLLDTAVAGKQGGNGVAFDWGVAKEVKEKGYKVIVAGGMNSRNVKASVKESGCEWVDVSSGVEERKGKKSEKEVFEFVRNAKN